MRGEYAAGLDSLTRALELFTALGDRLGQANAFNDLGRVQGLRGEFAAALNSQSRALELYTAMCSQ